MLLSAQHTFQKILSTSLASDNLAFREAIKQQMKNVRQELAGPAATALEKLLIDRIVACWLQLQTADIAAAQLAN